MLCFLHPYNHPIYHYYYFYGQYVTTIAIVTIVIDMSAIGSNCYLTIGQTSSDCDDCLYHC